MTTQLANILPIGLFAILIFIPVFVIERWRARREKTRRSPLVAQLLRGPGESLREALEEIRVETALWLAFTPASVLLVYGQHLSASYFGGTPETIFRVTLSVAMGFAMFGYGIYKSFGLARRGALIRLGYEGELAVAQELNQLMRQGAAVFHDVPGEGFNIDHVLVGPNGVYAIETKARMKPRRNLGKEDAKVVFDGKSLVFPTWTEAGPLEQASAQAKWLARWLSSAVGEAVAVRPALALPGWFVERTVRSDVAVFNPKSTAFLIKGWLREPLKEDQLRRIEHQLDQRCRNVEPSLYSRKTTIGRQEH